MFERGGAALASATLIAMISIAEANVIHTIERCRGGMKKGPLPQ